MLGISGLLVIAIGVVRRNSMMHGVAISFHPLPLVDGGIWAVHSGHGSGVYLDVNNGIAPPAVKEE